MRLLGMDLELLSRSVFYLVSSFKAWSKARLLSICRVLYVEYIYYLGGSMQISYRRHPYLSFKALSNDR